MQVLVISEKNNAAQRIASILSGGKAQRENIGSVPTYTFSRGSDGYTVMGLRGHIIELDYPAEYNQWYRVKPKELIRINPEKRVPVSSKGIVAALKKCAKSSDSAIIATDYDREGELIGVEALEIVLKEKTDIAVKRAHFSALTKGEIMHAFDNLVEINYPLAESAASRQYIDLAWGATLTRFISLSSNRVGKDFLSVGRVQSPTLAIIVDREKEIKAFKSKPYWVVNAKLEKGEDGKIDTNHKKGNFWKEEDAKKALDNAKGEKEGVISKLKIETKKDRPPPPYSTTMFLRDATRQGFSASSAMRVAEDLYTSGWISYPRTDNTVYPKSLDMKDILNKLRKSSFGLEAEEILSQKTLTPSRGKTSTTDHPPIHPADGVPSGKLTKQQASIYELVVRRFLATLAPASLAENTTAEVEIGKEPFIATGYRLVEYGWRKYFPYYNPKERMLPELKEGEKLAVKKVAMTEKVTEPPSRIGQGSLIQEMEKQGLGTKSTRHEIIQKLYNRNYIEGSPPRPTAGGMAVVDALEEYAATITQPEMTRTLEEDMLKISKGELKLDKVVCESQDMLTEAMVALEANRTQIGTAIREALAEQNRAGKCNKCGKDLTVRRSRRGKKFIGCTGFPSCRNTYPLPQTGTLDITGESCEICKSPIITLKKGRRKPAILCTNMECKVNSSSPPKQDEVDAEA